MEQWKFGDILRQTRERKGLGFTETAERLRIRPDILRAIEESNVSALPPRGYARNMVTGYARFLGLNPQEIGSMYTEEMALYEERRARVRARQNGESPDAGSYRNDHMTTRSVSRNPDRASAGPSRTGATGRVSPRQRPGDEQERPRPDRSGRMERTGRTDRADRSGRMERAERDYGEGRGAARRPSARTSREANRGNPLQSAVGAVSNAVGSISGSRQRPSFSSSGHGRQSHDPMLKANDYVSFLQGTREGGSRLPFILAAIIILLVLIIVGVLAFGGRGGNDNAAQDNGTLPVTTVEQAVQQQALTPPTKFTFGYSIDEGTESWVEIYVDGELQLGEVLTGPTEGSYDITGSVQFVSAASDGVHVTIDGEEQELQTDENGNVNMTFEFSDFLSDWQKAHGITPTTDSSSSSDGESSDAASDSSDGTSGTESADASGTADASADAAAADTATDTTADTTYYDDGSGTYYYDDGTGTY